jgi:membrane protein DedA with SNARE-associated domain
MQWWEVVRISLSSFLEQHGVLASFVVIFIEETGVPVPVPGDFLMLGVGVHARQSRVELWQALLVMELATLLGASILYVVAARGGRDLVYHYGRYIHLTPARLDQAERWLTHHGAAAIVVGRLTPGLRMATVIASGVFGISPWRFLPSLAVGAFLYILGYTLLGYFVGPPILKTLEGVHLPLGLLGSLVPLTLLLVWVARARRGLHLREATEAGFADRRHRGRDGAIAGGVATLISTLAMNVVIHMVGDLALLEPGSLVQRMQAPGGARTRPRDRPVPPARGRAVVRACGHRLGSVLRPMGGTPPAPRRLVERSVLRAVATDRGGGRGPACAGRRCSRSWTTGSTGRAQ